MDNEILKTIKARRSVRKYIHEKQIDDETLRLILEAGTFAATGMGRQSPIIIAVQNQEDIYIMRRLNATIMGNPNSDPFYGAPTVVVVLADKNIGTRTEDGSLVIGNMMLAAESLGISSCWIHRAKETFNTDEGKLLLKKWGISGDYEGVGNCILGYLDGEKPIAKERKADYIKIIK